MDQLLNANTFLILLDQTMKEKNLSHIDAIIEVCRMKDLDVEAIPELLSPKLRKQVQSEALDLNMLKRKKKKD